MSVFTGILGIVFFIVLAVLGLALYFLPAIIARQNGHSSFGGIFVLNLLLGWSLLGWIGALVWALSKPQPVIVVQGPAVYAQGYPQPPYPQPPYPQQTYPPLQPGYPAQPSTEQPQSYAPIQNGYAPAHNGYASTQNGHATAQPSYLPETDPPAASNPFTRPDRPGSEESA